MEILYAKYLPYAWIMACKMTHTQYSVWDAHVYNNYAR